jgi:hypothetical protein
MTTPSKTGQRGVNKIHIESTNETLIVQTWNDGEYLLRSGNNIISAPISTGDMSDFEGGFGALKVAEPQRKFSAKHVGQLSDRYQYVTSGGATITYNAIEGTADFQVPAGDRAFLQSTFYIPYEEARSQEYILTGRLKLASPAQGAVVRYGAFDDATDKIPISTNDRGGDGHFFQYNDSGLSVVERKTTGLAPFQSDTVIPQASFNKDPLDGTGPSGITFDVTKVYIFAIRVQWLGVGNVTFGLYLPQDNKFFAVHSMVRPTLNTTYMKRATLPIRFEVDNTAGAAAVFAKQICADSSSIGGITNERTVRTVSREYTQPNSETHTFTVQVAPEYNRDYLVPYSVNVAASNFNANEVLKLRVLINATPSVPLAYVPQDRIRVSTTPATFSGGTEYLVRYFTGGNSNTTRPDGTLVRGISSAVDGTPFTMTFLTDETQGSVGTVFITFSYEQLK